MKSSLEQESPTRVKLTIEVEPAELDPLYRDTLKRLAAEVKVPGFRKGKVPAPVLESRMGKEFIRSEVLREALPFFYRQAAHAEEIKPVAGPEIDVTAYEEGEPLTFTATLDVQPKIDLPPYRGIEVELPDTSASEEEIDAQLEQLRQRFATLEPVTRNAEKGDHALIDLTSYHHSDVIDAASAKDLLYEIGSEVLVPEVDKELEGKRAGDILKVNGTLPERFGDPYGGKEVSFSIVVKEVHAKRLPAIDDEFAKTASEFETLDELKQELRNRVEAFKKVQADVEIRNKILEELIDIVDFPLPEALVEKETQGRLASFMRDLNRHGLALDQYLERTGSSEESLLESYRKAAEQGVTADLILEAVAESEGIAATREEILEEVARIARAADRDPEELLADLEDAGRVQAVAGDILRKKALDFLVEHAKFTGEPDPASPVSTKESQ